MLLSKFLSGYIDPMLGKNTLVHVEYLCYTYSVDSVTTQYLTHRISREYYCFFLYSKCTLSYSIHITLIHKLPTYLMHIIEWFYERYMLLKMHLILVVISI